MAKELTLQELEKKLQDEQAHLEKLVATGTSLEFLIANGRKMTIEGKQKVTIAEVAEREKKEGEENASEYDDGNVREYFREKSYLEPYSITVEPTVFARVKKQIVEKILLPFIEKQIEISKKKIEALKDKISQLQQQGNCLGE